jgi:hypothetical protein
MTRVPLSAAALVLTTACAHAPAPLPPESLPPPPPPLSQADAEAELVAFADARIKAEVNADRTTLEMVLHEDYLITQPSGKTYDRDAFIDWVMSITPDKLATQHEIIRAHGNTAVVIDVSEDGCLKSTWTAVRNYGQWRIISESVTEVKKY